MAKIIFSYHVNKAFVEGGTNMGERKVITLEIDSDLKDQNSVMNEAKSKISSLNKFPQEDIKITGMMSIG
ncbi:hypothetical protein [Paenibacillus polymyxa]|uniref:hypothetical protein n=1 Tax=Paenibacillus polymyxa TaxID=1406 RepID=UPI000F87108C|nr:hypothetical protein [Paenibacillus polymyxa]RTZ37894.1 hypothetical protein EJ573_01410 [Paenibacillus polymyxa]WDM23803.1 hypothetical protein J4I02_10100 [Paenibacillus polymyxa]